MLPKIPLSSSEDCIDIKLDFSNHNLNYISNFEKDLEKYLNSNKKVVALNSGTSAIHMALILANVKRGDEVLCQSFTFSASANPIVYQGANPVFIDSEPETWNMCPNLLEDAIKDRILNKKKPKAIIVVHLYGMPAKIDEIYRIAKKYEIILIEDAAETLGSTYMGQKCGTFGDFGILSFNTNKIITAFGGGALVCKSEDVKNEAIYLATQAKDDAPHYQHSEVGYNYRMSNVVAQIGRGQMKVLNDRILSRRKNNKFYQKLFKNIEGARIFIEPNADFFSNHWLSCVIIDKEKLKPTREELRIALLEEGIESRPLWKPLHLQPVFKNTFYYNNNISEKLFLNGLCLPSGSNLSNKDRDRIAEVINRLL
tara:strand:+ start:23614 stop:24720 length:1107 start_codon:yes stop_codon:yes gene_type:complete